MLQVSKGPEETEHPVIGKQGHVGLMTAEAPRYPSVEGGNPSLERDLQGMGAKFHRVKGHYGGPENSYLIHGLDQSQMVELGKKYGQEAVIHGENGAHKLIYTHGPNAGQYHPMVGHEQWAKEQGPPEDYWTEAPGGGYFRLNFDFNQAHPLGKSEAQVGSRIWADWLKVLEFLRPGEEVDWNSAKLVLATNDRDMGRAICELAELEPTGDNICMVTGIYDLITGKSLSLLKSEVDTGEPIQETDVLVRPLALSAHQRAQEVKEAFKHGSVVPVKLNGKHSRGTLLATVEGKTLLLKHGSGPLSPAAGVNQVNASQAARECAFWAVAEAWGLSDFYPEAQWVEINGEQYAAIDFYHKDFKDLETIKESNPKLAEQIMEANLRQNLPHIWATIDYILGNVDSHAGNIVVKTEEHQPEPTHETKLIDHGSAFAGFSFAPGKDPATFTPYYLRFAYQGNFKTLPKPDQLEWMVWSPDPDAIAYFIQTLDAGALKTILPQYNIDPEACLARLHRLQAFVEHAKADKVLNMLFVGLLS